MTPLLQYSNYIGMEERPYNAPAPASAPMDVLKYAKNTSVILNISVIFNFLLTVATLAIAVLIFTRFREFPMIVQQDRGYLEPHEAGLFTLETDHVGAFLEHVLGTLRSYDCDRIDFSFIENFVEEKVILGIEKEVKDNLDKARKFNRHQIWQLNDFRRTYEYAPYLANKWIILAIDADVTNYENSKVTSKFQILEVKQAKDYLIAYLARVPITRKNPWGLVLVDLKLIPELSKFEKIWKESIDPKAPEFDPHSDEFREKFIWSTSWKPRKRKIINEDNP